MEVFQRVLTWLLSIEIIGLVTTGLAALGVPPMFAGIVAIVGLLVIFHKVTTDRYMLQRWRRKLGWF